MLSCEIPAPLFVSFLLFLAFFPTPLPHQFDAFMAGQAPLLPASCRGLRQLRLLSRLAGVLGKTLTLVSLGGYLQGVRPEIEHDHNALIQVLAQRDEILAELTARHHIATVQARTRQKVYASLSEFRTMLPFGGQRGAQ